MSTALVEQADPINALLRRADQGDRQAIESLRGECEAAPELWQEFGNIAREVGASRKAWAGEDPTPLEAALAERIATNWLNLHYVEAKYLQALGDLTFEEDTWHCRRIEQAERRYLRAIWELAQVRTIPQPAVQVNIGERQINVAGG